MALRAQVVNGRLSMDEPTMLAEGTVLNLVIDDEGDDLDEAERAELLESIKAGWREADAGRGIPATEFMKKLRARSR
jgi:hypothetical protein